ncbi:MAG: SDR family oxidoreductase [Planctomycetota bacterium]|nr:SDR family oxidoreductase [Planctomycetota bacterium]
MYSGQVAIVSGGLGDIGRAIAFEFARRGASVAVGDLREPKAASGLLAELESHGARVRYDRVDVTDSAAVNAWVSAVEAALGAPSLVVPNAAVVTLGQALEFEPAAWARELRVNLDGAFHLAQAAARRLRDLKRAGRIVFVGSWAGHAPHTSIPAYCAAKAGLRMLMKCLAAELAPHGILVNEVAPGWVDAGLSGRLFDANPGSREAARARVPVGRLIEAAEVARQVAHLCDPENRHITGSVLLMDGGLSLVAPASSARGKAEA